MTINSRPIPSIHQVLQTQQTQPTTGTKNTLKTVPTGTANFQNILNQTLDKQQSTSELKFSKHATMRLEARDIDISTEQMQRLQRGVSQAEAKGIKESLVMVDNIAFVVNIPNKTVVTALDQKEAKEHVFTNIDGAVVL